MRHTRIGRGLACGLALWLALLLPATAWAASFEVIYADSAGEGFFDPSLGEARREGFERALDTWSAHLLDDVTLRVQASFDKMGGSSRGATLGYAGPTYLMANFAGAPQADTWYVSSLADALTGADLKPAQPDFVVAFNSDIDGSVLGGIDWYYGEQDAAGDDVDFQTVAMHELCHGLGFMSSFRSDGSWGYYGMPTIFDTFLVNADGQRLVDLPESMSNVTADTYFAGDSALAAYEAAGGSGGVRIYAPSTWQSGSSLSHLDEATFRHQAGLMSPYYDEAVREIDGVVLGMLEDLGWQVYDPSAIPEPSAGVLLMGGMAVLAIRRRRSGRLFVAG
ncbi:MAG TPA: PEP-CTERM sorting domain-containing protein [Phycisphaerae bacterium]|nr:PEP-CTERM sorting domain-containing protein [Phycisphaerae bacterium]